MAQKEVDDLLIPAGFSNNMRIFNLRENVDDENGKVALIAIKEFVRLTESSRNVELFCSSELSKFNQEIVKEYYYRTVASE